MGNGVSINCMEHISIGEGVQIGPDVKIYDHDHDFRVPGGIAAEKFRKEPAGSVLKGKYPANSVIIQKRITEVTACSLSSDKD